MSASVTEWEPKLRQAIVKWLNELSDAVDKNGGKPVTWDYKKLQDRFRGFDCSYTAILEALRNNFFIEITQVGGRRQFNITDCGWTFLVYEKYDELRLLLSDPLAQKRNRDAIAKRKDRRKVYTDPTKRIIDDFRHSVEFGHKELLKQLRRDRGTPLALAKKAVKIDGELRTHLHTPIANIRFQNVLRPLLAFETRKFWNLIRDERGQIYHEFTPLHWNYLRFATFNGKPFALRLVIKHLQPTYLRKLSFDLYPTLHAYGESCGLSLILESDAISVFGDKKAADFQTKFGQVKNYIKQQEAECLAAGAA